MAVMDRSHGELTDDRCVVVVNPLETTGWDEQTAAFPAATVFHSTAWLRVLQETYGHTPLYLCQFAVDRLAACLPLMEVRSPLTGARGVSLPFTDSCSALLASPAAGQAIWRAAVALGKQRRWKYVECRGPEVVPVGAASSLEFCSHSLDLRPGEAVLETRLNSSVRRALRKAQAAGVQIEIATDAAAMSAFYRLHCLTRRRHGLPPQSSSFFENIARLVIQPGHGIIVLAHHAGQPVAGAVFLHFGAQAIYKFGASDVATQHLRPNNLVMWEAMRYYAVREFKSLHFGRTSMANEGLRRFKCSFGAQEQVFGCFKYNLAQARFVSMKDRSDTALNAFFRRLPLPFLRLAGRLLYPHLS